MIFINRPSSEKNILRFTFLNCKIKQVVEIVGQNSMGEIFSAFPAFLNPPRKLENR